MEDKNYKRLVTAIAILLPILFIVTFFVLLKMNYLITDIIAYILAIVWIVATIRGMKHRK
ncbi:hypothetical protein ABD86_13020 [Paenibacillus alvei]|nr:hypothetical protein [Paenibacillus alvei]MBG9744817.1 hypothetical protein [Paenibacillus alvei]